MQFFEHDSRYRGLYFLVFHKFHKHVVVQACNVFLATAAIVIFTATSAIISAAAAAVIVVFTAAAAFVF